MHKIGVQGFLYDDKSSFLKGPAEAPPEIRKTLYNGSANFFAENGVDLTQFPYHDHGDYSIIEYFEIESITSKNLEASEKLITLGGDHSITYPLVKATAVKHEIFDILHIDAHTDLYVEYEGDRYSHACPFSRIMEDKLANRLVQVGIRTLTSEQKEQALKYNVEIKGVNDEAIAAIPKFENPLYISLDIDAFDPAFAPGVSHHEPGGLTSRQVIDLINSLETPIIGADIVEYNPKRDVNGMTAALAAKMLKEIWSKMVTNI